jgi:hypothetical protein
MKRYDIINHLINLFGYKSYLEIGVKDPRKNFNRIKIGDKEGVDPAGKCKYVMTSDEFFSKNEKSYDIIFIDGLHRDYQVYEDINNSLNFLKTNGTIVVHDCNPARESYQTEEFNGGRWTGTVWKAWVFLRATRSDLSMAVVDCDYGVGIIQSGFQRPLNIKKQNVNYQYLRKRRKKILNLISPEQFLYQINRVA